MTSMTFATDATESIELFLVAKERLDAFTDSIDETAKRWIDEHGFKGQCGKTLVIPDSGGRAAFAVVGLGDRADRARSRFILGGARSKLPARLFRLGELFADVSLSNEALGWVLSGYRFTAYSGEETALAELICPDGVDAARIETIASGEAKTRDLINTPANDMGPDELEEATKALAKQHNASVEVVRGEDLLSQNFPMIHAVGAASPREPRLIDMRWGRTGPRLTLVGKGVCFDTGGLNLKPGTSMGLMKKDMGGAATVLGLASMIMSLELPLRLRVLIPAVENAVAGNAFRPGDILRSRKGLTVEINNTDAEGRLVLADALALADEEDPDLLVSMATLTGAARVAVGPDLAPFYTDDDAIASALPKAAESVADPVWRMPFWQPYESMIEPGVADLDNAPKGGFAGSITAALFLRRFVSDACRYTHFDIYGWQPQSAPARPAGGVGQGARALLEALPDVLDL